MSEQPAPETPQPPTPAPQKITIDMPKELTAVYANVAFISHTPAEVIIDFAQVLPRTPRGKILSRIIMSPMHAKMLHTALAQSLATYEQQFGPIRLPTNLAEQFFRFPPPEGGEKEE
ncbi:MAG: DUF3467 domain-containing protein [Anaerolineae bacterium]|nr:DUF3467 domain-containing protein [Anaerolineae bacterium]